MSAAINEGVCESVPHSPGRANRSAQCPRKIGQHLLTYAIRVPVVANEAIKPEPAEMSDLTVVGIRRCSLWLTVGALDRKQR